MARALMCCAVLVAAAGCATPADPGARAGAREFESLIPGTIGLVVAREPAGVVVRALREDGSAASAGLRVGDIIVSYGGAPVADERELNRRVADSRPGSVARVEFVRGGKTHRVDVPVKPLDTTPRG